MSNVYVRLTEDDLARIHAALRENGKFSTEDLVSKMDVLMSEMQPGTTLTLEAVAKKPGKFSES